jgi:hypothetical protein
LATFCLVDAFFGRQPEYLLRAHGFLERRLIHLIGARLAIGLVCVQVFILGGALPPTLYERLRLVPTMIRKALLERSVNLRCRGVVDRGNGVVCFAREKFENLEFYKTRNYT